MREPLLCRSGIGLTYGIGIEIALPLPLFIPEHDVMAARIGASWNPSTPVVPNNFIDEVAGAEHDVQQ